MPYLQLLIINRSGGLVFIKNLSPGAPVLNSNDSLRLGSTFHGLYAIANQVAPTIGAKGIDSIETANFVLQCMQTLTGTSTQLQFSS